MGRDPKMGRQTFELGREPGSKKPKKIVNFPDHARVAQFPH